MEMRPLSKEACEDIAEWGDKVLRDAMANQQLVSKSVFEAPEVLQQRINYTVGQIVNKALIVAHEEWSKTADSCAYCLEYEHGMKPATTVCTCKHHCGAMVCPEEPLRACPHPTYGDTSHCAEISCANYVEKHRRR